MPISAVEAWRMHEAYVECGRDLARTAEALGMSVAAVCRHLRFAASLKQERDAKRRQQERGERAAAARARRSVNLLHLQRATPEAFVREVEAILRGEVEYTPVAL